MRESITLLVGALVALAGLLPLHYFAGMLFVTLGAGWSLLIWVFGDSGE